MKASLKSTLDKVLSQWLEDNDAHDDRPPGLACSDLHCLMADAAAAVLRLITCGRRDGARRDRERDAMRVSTYSTMWSVVSKGFDVRGALDNWFTFSDEVSIAIPLADPDDSETVIRDYATLRGYNVLITRTPFPIDGSDPFAYGKTENAALQACTGDLLCQSNGDERWGVTRARLEELHAYLQAHPEVKSFFIPTIDLYGSLDRAVRCGAKWYAHGRGLSRGAVQFGLKADGRPDYNKTSTDELLLPDGSLAPTVALLQDLSIESVRAYAAQGWPLVYHLGFLDLASRADRAKWWGQFWVTATGGDPNGHITDVAELEKRHTFEHGLPMWPTLP